MTTIEDDAASLLGLIGSFWSNVYSGNFRVDRLLHARAQIDKQTHINLLELVASISRFNVPVFHTENWVLLRLRETDKKQNPVNLEKYGDGSEYGDGLNYGDNKKEVALSWAIDPDIVNLPNIANRIVAPTILWSEGNDYRIENGTITFTVDPFATGMFATQEVLENNTVVDRELVAWAYKGVFDLDYVYEQFGYAVNLALTSSEDSKRLTNAVFDALCLGTPQSSIEQMFSAAAGIPIAVGNETVEQIVRNNGRLLVITNKSVYRFVASATPTVVVGETLYAGQTLTTGLRFYEFNNGAKPEDLAGLTVDRKQLGFGYCSGLLFEDKEVPLRVVERADGFVEIDFEGIQGFAGDIDTFWRDIRASEVSLGYSFASLLDTRAPDARTSPLTASALPATINPMRFLCENLYRNNTFMVRLRCSDILNNGLTDSKLSYALRKIVPPNILAIILIEYSAADLLDGATQVGENVQSFVGDITDDNIGTDSITERITSYVITGRCL